MKHRRILVPAILFCSVVIVACEGSNPVDVSDGDAMSVLHAKGVSNLGQPSAVTAAAVGTDRVDVSWQDNSGNEDGFEIHRSIASAPYALLTTTLPNAEQHNDAALNPSTMYCYRIRARRIVGRNITYSTFSNVACATTGALLPPPPPPPPPAPTDFSVSA
jgi:hypothetical protein